MKFHEEAFEAAAEITAAVAEEAEIELNAEGAEKAAEFFSVLYKRLAAVARGEEFPGEKVKVPVKISCEQPEISTQTEDLEPAAGNDSWACEEEVYE